MQKEIAVLKQELNILSLKNEELSSLKTKLEFEIS